MTQEVSKKVLNTISIVIEQNSPMSQIRTVKYDCLSEEYFDEINSYICQLNEKYNSSVPYKLNDFIDNPI